MAQRATPVDTAGPRLCALEGVDVVLVQGQPGPVSSVPSAAPASRKPEDDPNIVTLVSWNVESGGADPQTIADKMRALAGVDLWGLVEVNTQQDQPTFEQAAGYTFASVISQSGGGDRLLAIYDDARFDLRCYDEVETINTTGNARAALALQLADANTSEEFIFVINHLYRGNDAERHRQATLLNNWAAEQALPVIAVGDYHFDWSVDDGCKAHDLRVRPLNQERCFPLDTTGNVGDNAVQRLALYL